MSVLEAIGHFLVQNSIWFILIDWAVALLLGATLLPVLKWAWKRTGGKILRELDTETPGGLTDVLVALERIEQHLAVLETIDDARFPNYRPVSGPESALEDESSAQTANPLSK